LVSYQTRILSNREGVEMNIIKLILATVLFYIIFNITMDEIWLIVFYVIIIDIVIWR